VASTVPGGFMIQGKTRFNMSKLEKCYQERLGLGKEGTHLGTNRSSRSQWWRIVLDCRPLHLHGHGLNQLMVKVITVV